MKDTDEIKGALSRDEMQTEATAIEALLKAAMAGGAISGMQTGQRSLGLMRGAFRVTHRWWWQGHRAEKRIKKKP